VEDMAGRDQAPMRDFFGPLRIWLMIGFGLVLVASAYGLYAMGVADAIVYVLLAVGVIIVLAMMSYLVVQGRRTWRAWFWMFHLDDEDLLMGRKKDE